MNKITDLLERNFDNYAERFPVSPHQAEVIDTLLKCRTMALGYSLIVCSDCEQHFVMPHPCHTRSCCSCGYMATQKWLYDVCQMLPKCPYDHITFTVPLFLRPFFIVNQKRMINILLESGSYAIRTWARKEKKFIPGIISICQTAGSDMHHNPHTHSISTSGGLSLDHNSWVEIGTFPAKALSKIYTAHFLELLRQAYLDGKLIIPPEYPFITSHKKLNKFIDEQVKDVFEKKQTSHPSPRSNFIKDIMIPYASKNKAWCVYVSEKPKDKLASSIPILYISRYLKTPPITNTRIISTARDRVVFKIKNHLTRQKERFVLSKDEFISRFLLHIPEKNFPMVRYYGLFANRSKATMIPKVLAALEPFKQRYAKLPDPKTIAESRPTWRNYHKKLTGNDPMLCPKCGKEMQFWMSIYPNSQFFKDACFDYLNDLTLKELENFLFDTS